MLVLVLRLDKIEVLLVVHFNHLFCFANIRRAHIVIVKFRLLLLLLLLLLLMMMIMIVTVSMGLGLVASTATN